MSKSERVIAVSVTVLFGVAAFLFFGFQYPYHIHYQEQYQLFEYTWGYFADTVSVPGGAADYIGRFLVQFFYYARAGAAVTALLLCALVPAVWSAFRRKTLPGYVSCFIPALLMWSFLCDENALLSAPVSLLISLAPASAVSGIGCGRLRRCTAALLTVALYFLCGPVAVVFPIIAFGNDNKYILFSALAVFAAVPVLMQYCCGYPLWRLYCGIHYHRFHNVVHVLLWVSVWSSVLLCLLSRLRLPEFSGKVRLGTGCAAAALLSAAVPLVVKESSDFLKEEQMKYDFMVQHRMWNRIMMTADAAPPHTPMTVTCLNLALAMSGRMAEHQFEYFQNGPDGLVPVFVRDFTSPLPTAEVYYQLGMINTAQRYTFEAQEAIPDFQKSARCCRRLAETNYINGDVEVSGKYLKALGHTLFYRDWARRFPDSEEYGRLKELRLNGHDFLFSQSEMDSMLGLLYVENRENTAAFDYLMSWCLLCKNLDRFEECLRLRRYSVLPKSYQEAFLLHRILTDGSIGTVPSFISSSCVQRLRGFLQDYGRGSAVRTMQKNYGDTYWFYYYFRYNGDDEKTPDTGGGTHGSGL